MGDLWFMLIPFGFIIVFYAITFPFIIKMQKARKREKQEKHERKMQEKKLEVELELAKKKANFEIEKERESKKPKFCSYCGAKHKGDAEKCDNCGSDI